MFLNFPILRPTSQGLLRRDYIFALNAVDEDFRKNYYKISLIEGFL